LPVIRGRGSGMGDCPRPGRVGVPLSAMDSENDFRNTDESPFVISSHPRRPFLDTRSIFQPRAIDFLSIPTHIMVPLFVRPTSPHTITAAFVVQETKRYDGGNEVPLCCGYRAGSY